MTATPVVCQRMVSSWQGLTTAFFMVVWFRESIPVKSTLDGHAPHSIVSGSARSMKGMQAWQKGCLGWRNYG